MFQLILYSQAQFSNFTRQRKANEGKGSFGRRPQGFLEGLHLNTTQE